MRRARLPIATSREMDIACPSRTNPHPWGTPRRGALLREDGRVDTMARGSITHVVPGTAIPNSSQMRTRTHIMLSPRTWWPRDKSTWPIIWLVMPGHTMPPLSDALVTCVCAVHARTAHRIVTLDAVSPPQYEPVPDAYNKASCTILCFSRQYG